MAVYYFENGFDFQYWHLQIAILIYQSIMYKLNLGKEKMMNVINIDEWKDDPILNFYSENNILYKDLGELFNPPLDYLKNYKNFIYIKDEKTNFVDNKNERIHRWSPYLEGFSSAFVLNMIKKLKISKEDTILDPFAGCGTTNITAQLNNFNSIGIDINPTMNFILNTKLNWDINLPELKREISNFKLVDKISIEPPPFLENDRQFKPEILRNLLRIKQSIDNIHEPDIKNLFLIAFSSILLDSSNLKRSPSIGYTIKSFLTDEYPIKKFNEKLKIICDDLEYVMKLDVSAKTKIILGDSKKIRLKKNSIDHTISSPPYLNFFDYPGNYKLEMSWLGHVSSTRDLKVIKDEMVVCDNVSKGLIRDYANNKRIYYDDWITDIENRIEKNMKSRPTIRRSDYPIIVRKYFDDLYSVMKNVSDATVTGGNFVLVVGDSLITDVYVPTDLILAKIGENLGFDIERIQITRSRRSGIRRSFKLRETITYLKKIT